jgi:hypothetical protein
VQQFHGKIGWSNNNKQGKWWIISIVWLVCYYVKQFGNLYKYSNQGWESLNQKLKRVYLNNTSLGGNVGGAKWLKKGHVEKPLWLFLARSKLWRTGDADDNFNLQKKIYNSFFQLIYIEMNDSIIANWLFLLASISATSIGRIESTPVDTSLTMIRSIEWIFSRRYSVQ